MTPAKMLPLHEPNDANPSVENYKDNYDQTVTKLHKLYSRKMNMIKDQNQNNQIQLKNM